MRCAAELRIEATLRQAGRGAELQINALLLLLSRSFPCP